MDYNIYKCRQNNQVLLHLILALVPTPGMHKNMGLLLSLTFLRYRGYFKSISRHDHLKFIFVIITPQEEQKLFKKCTRSIDRKNSSANAHHSLKVNRIHDEFPQIPVKKPDSQEACFLFQKVDMNVHMLSFVCGYGP